jgi:hypothetical protein
MSAACLLFVTSLPLSKTATGATLRRWAGVCFILAFLPSLVGGIFYAAPITSTSSTSPVTTTSAPSPPAPAPSVSGLKWWVRSGPTALQQALVVNASLVVVVTVVGRELRRPRDCSASEVAVDP